MLFLKTVGNSAREKLSVGETPVLLGQTCSRRSAQVLRGCFPVYGSKKLIIAGGKARIPTITGGDDESVANVTEIKNYEQGSVAGRVVSRSRLPRFNHPITA